MRMAVSIAPVARAHARPRDYDGVMRMPEREPTTNRPVVTVAPRGADRLRAGHPWIYRSDVRASAAAPGDIVVVASERGRPLGYACWSSTSQIALRFLGPDVDADAATWIGDRVDAALAFRDRLDIDGTAWRALNAEGDRLPGLIADVYGTDAARYLVIQTLTQAMDRLRPVIVRVLAERLRPAGILARNDPKVRRLEGLPEEITVEFGEVPERVDVRDGPLNLRVDLRTGQKTGLFLDQRENHEAAARYARGRALDAFSYHGGFALRMAAVCNEVVVLESSAAAVAQLRANAGSNGISNIEVREVNVFDELRELEVARERFDTIVLDPPAFAKNRASVPRAAAGYKEINLRALRLLSPGGCLMTCSCSYNIDPQLFRTIVEDAAADAPAVVSVLETRAQSRDHPILLNVPETHYLKCLVLRKLA
jgi:23S rRNA (cytosine1962-C5)-methyltransferase